jgi:hypothetical protein
MYRTAVKDPSATRVFGVVLYSGVTKKDLDVLRLINKGAQSLNSLRSH